MAANHKEPERSGRFLYRNTVCAQLQSSWGKDPSLGKDLTVSDT